MIPSVTTTVTDHVITIDVIGLTLDPGENVILFAGKTEFLSLNITNTGSGFPSLNFETEHGDFEFINVPAPGKFMSFGFGKVEKVTLECRGQESCQFNFKLVYDLKN